MRKIVFLILVFLSAVALLSRFASTTLPNLLGFGEKAGVRIEANKPSSVSIDKKSLGRTPFQKENLSAGEHLIELSSSDGSWQGYVTLNPGTLTVVNRELAQTAASSSGEIISLKKGRGAIITSSPNESDVTVDGKDMGKTPLNLNNLSAGEHLFHISHTNFLSRSVRATETAGYNLILSVDLAVSEADLTQVPTEVVQTTTKVVVKQTPTGFLRVRDAPSLSASEIGRVSSGDSLILIEEQGSWDKVKLTSGKEGYVSTQYVEKQTQ